MSGGMQQVSNYDSRQSSMPANFGTPVAPLVHIGFTGTQVGMTDAQLEGVRHVLHDHLFIAHHGDCNGADAQFDTLVRTLPNCHGVEIHPGDTGPKRAFCKPDPARDVVHPVQSPLTRNQKIVNAVSCMIACPKEEQMQRRSGTWSTIRYAMNVGRPMVIIFPNGGVCWYGDDL